MITINNHVCSNEAFSALYTQTKDLRKKRIAQMEREHGRKVPARRNAFLSLRIDSVDDLINVIPNFFFQMGIDIW